MHRKKQASKTISVEVKTVDSQLEFEIQKGAPGQQLFDQVVRTLGLREVWYFGIQYIDKDNNPSWVRLDKKIAAHDFAPGSQNVFKFMVKFYPENVAEELIENCTIKHFYLQVKNDIMNGKVYCPAETAVVLAAYACAVKYGPYSPETCPDSLPIERLIPERGQYKLSDDEWYERIITYYKDQNDISKEDAMMQYLQLAQDLEMYGVEKFPIKNKKGTSLCLGIDALGLSIYGQDDLLNPTVGFPWSEILNLSYHEKKFVIKPTGKLAKDFYFMVEKSKINKRILSLCTGNHQLYIRRRKTDSIEVQQMKMEAKENREMKEQERRKLQEERLQRMEYEQKLMDLKAEMRQKETDFNAMIAKVNEFQGKISELECLLQQEREERLGLEANQVKLAEMNERLKQETAASSEERATLIAQRDVVERQVEEQKAALALKEAEKARTEAELERLRKQKEAVKHSMANGCGDYGSQDGYEEGEARDFEFIENLSQPENTRTTTVSGNLDLKQKLENLKSDLSSVRDQSKMNQIDFRYEHNVREGTDKYKTLRNIRRGNTKMRVDQFESM